MEQETANPNRVACSECGCVVPHEQHAASCYFHPENVRASIERYRSLHRGRR